MYSQVEIFGNQDASYMWSKSGTMTNEEIEELIDSGIQNPLWDEDTLLLALYQGNLKANDSYVPIDNIIGYKIQREDANVKTRIDLGEYRAEESTIRDYSVKNDSEVKYYIFPITSTEEVKTIELPVITDSTTTNYDGWTLAELLEGDNKNEYKINKDNIWILDLNIESQPFVLNNDKTFTDGFGRFSRIVSGDRMYLTGGVTGLIGHVGCSGEYISDNTDIIKKFYQFCNNPSLKLLKDIKGNVLVVDVEPQVEANYDDSTIAQQTTVSFKFREVEDISNVVIKGLVV